MAQKFYLHEVYEGLAKQYEVSVYDAQEAVGQALRELKALRPKKVPDGLRWTDQIDETLAGALYSRAKRYL